MIKPFTWLISLTELVCSSCIHLIPPASIKMISNISLHGSQYQRRTAKPMDLQLHPLICPLPVIFYFSVIQFLPDYKLPFCYVRHSCHLPWWLSICMLDIAARRTLLIPANVSNGWFHCWICFMVVVVSSLCTGDRWPPCTAMLLPACCFMTAMDLQIR